MIRRSENCAAAPVSLDERNPSTPPLSVEDGGTNSKKQDCTGCPVVLDLRPFF